MKELKRKLINKHLENWTGLKQASIEHFSKSGYASGAFLLALDEMLEEYASQFRPSSEAIKSAMDKAREYSLGNNSFTKEWAEYRDRIAGELGSGWISVDITKLPKSNNGFSEWVLVAYSRGMVDRDRYDFENNYWISKGDDVTHWQPLPSPPTK